MVRPAGRVSAVVVDASVGVRSCSFGDFRSVVVPGSDHWYRSQSKTSLSKKGGCRRRIRGARKRPRLLSTAFPQLQPHPDSPTASRGWAGVCLWARRRRILSAWSLYWDKLRGIRTDHRPAARRLGRSGRVVVSLGSPPRASRVATGRVAAPKATASGPSWHSSMDVWP